MKFQINDVVVAFEPVEVVVICETLVELQEMERLCVQSTMKGISKLRDALHDKLGKNTLIF